MNRSITKTLLLSLLVSYLFSAVLLLALSFALYRLKLKEPQINLAVFLIYGIACLIGGLLAGKRAGSRRFFWGLLAGALYFAVLFAVSWISSHGLLPDFSRSMTVLACCSVGGMIGGMIS